MGCFYSEKRIVVKTPTKFLVVFIAINTLSFLKSVDRPTGAETIVRIIETFYNAQLRFAVKNDSPYPDLEIPD